MRGLVNGVLSFGLAGILSGCVQLGVNELHPDERRNSNYSTILVQNEGMDPVSIYDYARIGSINPGQIACLRINYTSQQMQLSFRIMGNKYFTQMFDPMSQTGGWYLRVGRNPRIDAISLMPIEKCEIGRIYREIRP